MTVVDFLPDLPMGSQHVRCLQRSNICIQHSSFIRRKASSRIEGEHLFVVNFCFTISEKNLPNLDHELR